MNGLIFSRPEDSFVVKSNLPIPAPDSDEIRVKVLACALNPVDAKVRNWMPTTMDTIILGLDVFGVVDEIGSSVSSLKAGDFVLYHGRMFKGIL